MASFVHLIDQRRLIGPGGSTVSGQIFFYFTGTTVKAPIYQDAELLVPAANPVVVGAGQIIPLIFLDDTVVYRRVIQYSDGSLDEQDPLGNVISEGGLGIPVGSVIDFSGIEAPEGFVFCYGQELPRIEYAELFAVISTQYGAGNGSTTFNVPDYRGRVGAGKDNMGGFAASRLNSTVSGTVLGAVGGTEEHILTIPELPSHSHTLTDPGHAHQQRRDDNGGASATAGGNPDATYGALEYGNTSSSVTGITLGSTGSGEGHTNVQPTIVVNKIIKTKATNFLSMLGVDIVADADIIFEQSGTAPLTATVESKARQILSAADFTGFDATGLTASTSAIQNAINEGAARGRCDVLIPNGAKTGALIIPSGVTLKGPDSKAVLTADTGSYTTLTLNGSDSGIENLTIVENAKSGGGTFLLACGTTGKDRNTIKNIVTYSSWQLIADSGTGNGVHTTTKLKEIQAKAHRGPGLAWTRGFAFLELDHVIIDYVGVAASNFTGFSASGAGLPAGAGGLIIERCDVLGTMGVYTNANQIGYNFTDLSAVRIRNSRADTCGSDGWRFNNMNGIIMDDVAAGLCDGHGMVFTSCTSVLANKLFLFGRNYLPTPAANKDGLRFVSGNVGCLFGTVLTRDHTGHGVHKVAAQPGAINISGLSSFGNTGRGIKTVGASGFVATNAQFGGNVAGNYDLGGGFDYISGQLASGAFLPSIGPGPVTG